MSQLSVGIKLIDPIREIEKKVLRAFVDELNVRMPKAVPLIERDISTKLRPIFTTSDEYKSLLGGTLMGEFGIPDGEEQQRLDNIIDVLVKSLRVEFKRLSISGNNIRGGIRLYAFLADFEDILSLSDGVVNTEKGVKLPWLEWLLLEGDRIIINDYHVQSGDYQNAAGYSSLSTRTTKFRVSRSGLAIMVKKGVWRVPPEFSGTINNNWITRAVDFAAFILGDLISDSIVRNIENV